MLHKHVPGCNFLQRSLGFSQKDGAQRPGGSPPGPTSAKLYPGFPESSCAAPEVAFPEAGVPWAGGAGAGTDGVGVEATEQRACSLRLPVHALMRLFLICRHFSLLH